MKYRSISSGWLSSKLGVEHLCCAGRGMRGKVGGGTAGGTTGGAAGGFACACGTGRAIGSWAGGAGGTAGGCAGGADGATEFWVAGGSGTPCVIGAVAAVGLVAVLEDAWGCSCAWALALVVGPADAVVGFCGTRRMSSTSPSLLVYAGGSKSGVESVTLNSELGEKDVSGLYGRKLPGM